MPRTISSPASEDACPALRVPDRPGAKIALRGVQLRCQISGMSQRTSIYQTFINQEADAIEAVYTFPLPDGAAVCGFEVVTADRVLTGQIEESEKAVDQYEQAVGQGHGAFLMEQDRPDVFSVRVGNLKPKQAATVRMTYVCPLERMDKSIRVAFPTTLAPRYATDTGSDPLEAMVDGDALNPPHVLHVPYGLSMEVEIDLGREVVGVTSPSHAIKVAGEAGHAGRDGEGQAQASTQPTRVTLGGGWTEMNRDIVLNIALRKEHGPCVQCERGKDGAGYLAVTFVPEFDVDDLAGPDGGGPAPGETVFVLDCSGSMQGDSIRQATAALELCLRGMNIGDTFNICRFGSSFELMASEPLRYTQETLDRAIAYVRRGADMGGTELYGPLEAILRQPPVVGKVRQIVLLTDGQVTNEPACVDIARRNRRRNRIFSFGIGPACSTHLVKGLARASGGAAEFITPGERIDDKVLRTFSRLASPLVADVSIDWAGAEVQTLAELPPIFDGDVLAVFGRSPGRLPAEVTLSCTTDTGPKSWKIAVPPPVEVGEQPGVIATMWARRTIQSLEEVNNLAGARSRPAVKNRERDMVVSLSREFGLLSSLTTFIAVEHRTVEERNEGRPALRRVPVMLAAGWGGVDTAQRRGVSAAGAGTVTLGACRSGFAAPAPLPPVPLLNSNMLRKAKIRGPRVVRIESPASPAPPPVDAMQDSMDRSDAGSGLFDLTRESDETSFGALLDEIGPSTPGNAGDNSTDTRTQPTGGGHTSDKKCDRILDRTSALAEKGNQIFELKGPRNPGDELLDLLSYQLADGSFGGGAELGGHAGTGDAGQWRAKVKQLLAGLGGSVADDELVLRTVIAVLLLTSRFADQEVLWRRAHGKAIRFLARVIGKSTSDMEQWLNDTQLKLAAP